MRTGQYRDLFHPDHLMTDREDFANNYARGFTLGARFAQRVLEMVRKVADSCDGLQGFILCHSLGGGTGSGVAPHIMQGLADGYGKKTKLQLSVYPAPQVRPTIYSTFTLQVQYLSKYMSTGYKKLINLLVSIQILSRIV